ncbi:MAG TPA: hypothetical protein VLB72_10005 [Burkholderiales bacterium]|nr:hypothetical protein [Burkholderiales bacterium]
MSKTAIRTLELQALEALRQAAEDGTTQAARESCIETALACMRAIARLTPPKPRRRRSS